jgi:hypothetical protein
LPQLDELSHWKSLRAVLEADLSALEVEHRKLERRMEKRNGRGEAVSKIERRLESIGEEEIRIAAELGAVGARCRAGRFGQRRIQLRWGPSSAKGGRGRFASGRGLPASTTRVTTCSTTT